MVNQAREDFDQLHGHAQTQHAFQKKTGWTPGTWFVFWELPTGHLNGHSSWDTGPPDTFSTDTCILQLFHPQTSRVNH